MNHKFLQWISEILTLKDFGSISPSRRFFTRTSESATRMASMELENGRS